jgi:hypothetical protein
MMSKRQEAVLAGNKGLDFFCRINMNSSYGYDIMNEEHFAKITVMDKRRTELAQIRPNYMSTRKLNDNSFLMQHLPKTYRCSTPIVCGFFTLDNAKYWYLNFIYNFMTRAFDMSRMHFVEGDTDSMY